MEEKLTPEQFTYWLQGFFELMEGDEVTPRQVRMIKEHLGHVFKKVTSDGGPREMKSEPKKMSRSDIPIVDSKKLEEALKKFRSDDGPTVLVPPPGGGYIPHCGCHTRIC